MVWIDSIGQETESPMRQSLRMLCVDLYRNHPNPNISAQKLLQMTSEAKAPTRPTTEVTLIKTARNALTFSF